MRLSYWVGITIIFYIPELIGPPVFASSRLRVFARCLENYGSYNDLMKTYTISVPSGKYTINLDNDSCAYDAYEYFLANDLTTNDIATISNDDFDVYDFITITR